MSDELAPVRYTFRPGVAVEHVLDNTYRWVDPITGEFRGYVVALEIEYASTLDIQRGRSR